MRLLLIGFLLAMAACDPGLEGDLKVFNHTDTKLTVVTFEYGETDSSTIEIEPNTDMVIRALSGLGDQSTFDCCPCKYDSLYINHANGNVKLDANDKSNWEIPNKAEQKRFGGEDLRCELHIYQSDL